MLKTQISSTALTSAQADVFFGGTGADHYRGDHAMSAIIRACVHPKLKDGQTFYGTASVVYETLDNLTGSKMDKLRRLTGNKPIMDEGQLFIFCYPKSKEEAAQILDFIQAEFASHFPGFSEVTKIAHYYTQTGMRAMAYANPDRRTSVLFMDRAGLEAYHLALVAIPAACPYIFADGEKSLLTEFDRRLLSAMKEETPDVFLACVSEAAAQYDFRTARIKKLLDGFEQRYERDRARALRRDVENARNKVAEYNRRVSEYLAQLRESNIMLAALEFKLASGESEGENVIQSYFLGNPSLVLEEVADNEMDFGVKTTLRNYDEDQAENCIENRHSCLYTKSSFSRDDTELLLRAVFLDRTVTVNFCADYHFNLNGSVSANGHHDFDQSDYFGYMPNTHVQEYSCLGGNEDVVNEYLAQRNYIGAIEQCIYSAGNLNFNDFTVLERFAGQFLNSRKDERFINLPDGTLVSPTEAIAWLKEQNNGTTQEEKEG